MTRLGRYLSPDHYKSRYNLYAGDVERTPSLSTDFMQPNMAFNFGEGKNETYFLDTQSHCCFPSLFLLIDHNKTGITK